VTNDACTEVLWRLADMSCSRIRHDEISQDLIIMDVCYLARDRTDVRTVLENATGRAAAFFRRNLTVLEWILRQRREWVPRFTTEPLLHPEELLRWQWHHRSRQERLIQHRITLAVRSGMGWLRSCCEQGRPLQLEYSMYDLEGRKGLTAEAARHWEKVARVNGHEECAKIMDQVALSCT